jgi:hypothetical protein
VAAAFGDFEVSVRAASEDDSRYRRFKYSFGLLRDFCYVLLAALNVLDDPAELIDSVKAHHCIYIGKAGQKVFLIALGKASAHYYSFALAGSFSVADVFYGFECFFPGFLYEGAGIDYQHVGLVRILCKGDILFNQVSGHQLGIDQVLRTAQTYESHFKVLFLLGISH